METKDIFGNEAKTEVKTAKSADVKKTTTRKTPAKAAAKETVKETKKEAAKTVETVKKAAGETKEAAKKVEADVKATAKSVEAEVKTAVTAKNTFDKELFFQYANKQVDEETLVARIVEDAKEQNVEIKELKMYLKPEDNACYYVANGNVAGRVNLY